MDESGGLVGAILGVLRGCSVNVRASVSSHLVFCGGGAMIPGLLSGACDRATRVIETDPSYQCLRGVLQKLPRQRLEPQKTHFLRSSLPWVGASLFASLPSNARKFVKAEDLKPANSDSLYIAPDWQSLNSRDWRFLSPVPLPPEDDESSGVGGIRVTRKIVAASKRPAEPKLKPAEMRKKLKEVFADIDADDSGTIDKKEFIRAMKYFKINLNAREVDLLYERIDQDGNDSIDYNEFVELLGFKARENEISAQLRKDTDALIDRLRKDVEQQLGRGSASARRMQEVFQEIDIDGSNSIDKKEFNTAMKIFKINITSREVNNLYERYDTDRSGNIDYNEFLELFGFQRAEEKSKISEELRTETDKLIKKLRRDLEREISRGTIVNRDKQQQRDAQQQLEMQEKLSVFQMKQLQMEEDQKVSGED